MSDPALTAASMAELLRIRADRIPDELAFCFLIDGEEEGPRLTYAELDRQARSVAAALQEVAAPGDRALLVYAPGLEFISAFFGCQYAGVVPVPVYPPRFDQALHGWRILAHIAADCEPRVVLTGGQIAPFISGGIHSSVPALSAAHCIVTDDLKRARHWREPAFDPDLLALLQYTSGSTAAPKGVMVSHRNLMYNARLLSGAAELNGRGGVGVSWLPTYHDMGLIAGVLQAVFESTDCYLMSPLVLLRWPDRWLRAICRYRAEISAGPDFAYDFCVERIAPEERTGLDLSCWNMAVIGSDSVSAKTIERFTAAFEPYGFHPEAFCPGYGLAEATVFGTGNAKAALPVVRSVSVAALEQGRAVAADPNAPDARAFVGCGHTWLDLELRIVDPETCAQCEEGHVGEIWVKGPSVARGYWNRPEETKETFHARLSDTGDGPFLRTGDLGFVKDGNLFVTGRIKDVLIVRGRNHYPQDIEETVQSVHPGLRRGCGAAFEVTKNDRPWVVVVQEVDRRCRTLDTAKLVGDIRQAVAEQHELQVHDVQLLAHGSIPKTSSGKVRRRDCRLAYERGELRVWKGKREKS